MLADPFYNLEFITDETFALSDVPLLERFRDLGHKDAKLGVWRNNVELAWLKPLELIEYMAGYQEGRP